MYLKEVFPVLVLIEEGKPKNFSSICFSVKSILFSLKNKIKLSFLLLGVIFS